MGAIIVTATDLLLMMDNLQWLLPKLAAAPQTYCAQKIVNLIEVVSIHKYMSFHCNFKHVLHCFFFNKVPFSLKMSALNIVHADETMLNIFDMLRSSFLVRQSLNVLILCEL
jgi:hypothetical protein